MRTALEKSRYDHARRAYPPCQSCGERTHKPTARLCLACYKVLPRFTKEQRFWAKVHKGKGCWEWVGMRSWQGYGQLKSGPQRRQVTQTAHRMSWEIHNGAIPPGQEVCHRCDNPPCVRPDHLFLGTHAENVNDMWAKGRGPTGERNGQSKLSAVAVRAIRAASATGSTHAALGRAYGVSESSIRDVVSRRHWRHVA